MWHFHLSRYWFDKIKNGSKKIEYRFLTERLQKQLGKDSLRPGSWSKIRFYELPSDVRAFFLKQKNIVQLFDDSIFVCFEFGGLRNV